MRTLASAAVEHFGTVDILCNNAGIWSMGSLWETDLAEWKRIHDVNLWGVVHGLRTFIPLMLQNPTGGHIVNVSSTSGLVATPFRAPYAASKYAVVGVTDSLRAEIKQRALDLRVTLVCPGKLDTDIFAGFQGLSSKSLAARDEINAAAALLEDTEAMSPRDAGQMVKDAIVQELPLVLPGISPFIRRWVQRKHQLELEAIDRDIARNP